MNHPLLDTDKSYTFRSYFEMTSEPDEILAEFGYSWEQRVLTLPQSQNLPETLPTLQRRLEQSLQVVTLTSETARRETLVAPILLEIAAFCGGQLRIEYGLNVNQWLKGTLDYLLRSHHSFLVVEAKQDDLTRGFTQLAVEMIALQQWYESESILYGAVTIGEVWRFGRLDPQNRKITQDLNLFRVPADLQELVSVIVGTLTENRDHS